LVGVFVAMCLVGAAVFIVSPTTIALVTYRYGGLANPTVDPTGMLRLRIQEAGLKALAESPVLGVGPGAFPDAIVVSGAFVRGWVAHNSLLEVLVETGYVGGSALVALLLWGLWAAIRFLRRLVGSGRDQGRVVQMTAGLIAAYVAGIVGSLFLSNVLYEPAFGLVAIMLVGTVYGSRSADAEESASD
jgi:O-antigen ligase